MAHTAEVAMQGQLRREQWRHSRVATQTLELPKTKETRPHTAKEGDIAMHQNEEHFHFISTCSKVAQTGC